MKTIAHVQAAADRPPVGRRRSWWRRAAPWLVLAGALSSISGVQAQNAPDAPVPSLSRRSPDLGPAGAQAPRGLATTEELHRVLPCYDPRRSGVAWDGVTDDTAAMTVSISAAIREAGTSGACVQLPKGTGVLGEVDLPTFPNGLRIVGAGEGATFIQLASTRTNLWVSKADDTANTQFEAAQFTVLPRGPMTAGTTFLLSNVFGVYLHDIAQNGGWNFTRFGTESFQGHVKGVNKVYLDRTAIRNFRGVVHEFGTGFDAYVYGNEYDTDRCEAADAACQPISFLVVRNWGGLQLGLNDAIHCGNCYVVEPDAPGKEVDWMFVQGAQADTCAGNGWMLHAVAGATIKGFNAVQLWGSSCARDGLLVNEDAGGRISDINLVQPVLLTNDGAGLHVLLFDGKATITAPTIAGNSAHAPDRGAGVFLDQGTGSVSIVGGLIGATSGTNRAQRYNLQVGRLFKGDVRVTGTNLCDGATGPLEAAGQGALVVADSPCVNPGGTRAVAVGASPFRYRAAIAPTSFTLAGGGVSSVTVAGVEICTAAPCAGRAQPGETVVVTFSGPPPSMAATRD